MQNELFQLFKGVSVNNPYDHNQSYEFSNIEELISILIKFIKYDSRIDELQGLSQKIIPAFYFFSNTTVNTSELNAKIEDLATGFECFLKKIAVVRYEGNSTIIFGDDSNYKGLINSTLGNLLEGKVCKKRRNAQTLMAPIVSFTYNKDNVRVGVYEKIRQIRNDIHAAPLRNPIELFELFKIIFASYLFAIEENIQYLKSKVDSLYIYANTLQDQLSKINSKYTELDAAQRSLSTEDIPDLFAFQWQDDYDTEPYSFSPENIELPEEKRKNESVLKLCKRCKKFWLIGEPGSGKTTSIKKIAYEVSKDFLRCNTGGICPIYLEASRFDQENDIIHRIQEILNVTEIEVEKYFAQNNLLILIDGINEISEENQKTALTDINKLLNLFPGIYCILSSRKYFFQNKFNLPVYELMPLDDTQIKGYLEKYTNNEKQAITLYNDLMSSKGVMIDLARNPLLLCMITRIANDGHLPNNRGLLFRQFGRWLLNRENKISVLQSEIKENILSSLAFVFRTHDSLFLNKNLVIDHIKNAICELNIDCNVFDLYSELLNNGLLIIDKKDDIQFSHELFLEYYTAEYLLKKIMIEGFDFKDYANKNTWHQPIIILTGLLTNCTGLINEIMKYNLILTARCLASGAKVDNAVLVELLLVLEKMLDQNINQRKIACISLLELGNEDALRVIIKNSKKIDSIFHTAIKKTDRPEIASLKLLRFGQTGRHRIRLCLQAISNSAHSTFLTNTEEVAYAQLEILKDNPLSNEIATITKMGIATQAMPEVGKLIRLLIKEKNINTSEWRACVDLAANENITGCASIIINKFNETTKVSGESEYSILLACSRFNTQEFLGIPRERVVKCLDSDLYTLAIKYIKHFNFIKEFPYALISKYIDTCAAKGKIGALAKFKQLYFEDVPNTLIRESLEMQLKNNNLLVVLQYGNVLSDILGYYSLWIKGIIISSPINSTYRKIRFIRKLVKIIKNDHFFKNIGIVTMFNYQKKYGFVNSFVGENQYFFNFGAVKKLTNQPVVGDIVYYDQDSIVRDNLHDSRYSPKILKFEIL